MLHKLVFPLLFLAVFAASCSPGTAQHRPVSEYSVVLSDSIRQAWYEDMAAKLNAVPLPPAIGTSNPQPRNYTAEQVREAFEMPIWTAPDGAEYAVHQGPKGGHYVFRTSKKTGKQYKVYLRKQKDGSFSTYR